MKGDAGVVLKRTILAILYTVILVILLGIGLGLATYYRYEYAYIVPNNTYDSHQIILGHGLKKAFSITIVYLLYASLREAALSRLTQPSQWRAFRVRLANQITGYFTAYFAFFYFLVSFNMVDERAYAGFFFIVRR